MQTLEGVFTFDLNRFYKSVVSKMDCFILSRSVKENVFYFQPVLF